MTVTMLAYKPGLVATEDEPVDRHGDARPHLVDTKPYLAALGDEAGR